MVKLKKGRRIVPYLDSIRATYRPIALSPKKRCGQTYFSDLLRQPLYYYVDKSFCGRFEHEVSSLGVHVHHRIVLSLSGERGRADVGVSESLLERKAVPVSRAYYVFRSLPVVWEYQFFGVLVSKRRVSVDHNETRGLHVENRYGFLRVLHFYVDLRDSPLDEFVNGQFGGTHDVVILFSGNPTVVSSYPAHNDAFAGFADADEEILESLRYVQHEVESPSPSFLRSVREHSRMVAVLREGFPEVAAESDVCRLFVGFDNPLFNRVQPAQHAFCIQFPYMDV